MTVKKQGKSWRYWLERVDRKQTILAGENMDFFWDREQVVDLKKMLRAGKSVAEMSTFFGRHPAEIVVILYDIESPHYPLPEILIVPGRNADQLDRPKEEKGLNE